MPAVLLNRRAMMSGVAAAALAGFAERGWARPVMPDRHGGTAEGLARHVDPFIGTAGHGHTYPGATVPFGMVQLSPDTSNKGWDSCSGYHQQDGSIMGFSHTHLSGTGCADLLDVLLVPATGPVLLTPGEIDDPDTGYRSRYDRETASPGYYGVRLTDTLIDAELTVTPRAGLHRYRFPQGEPGHILIDFQHGQRDWGRAAPPTRVKNASLRLIGNDTLVGSRQVFQWAAGRWIHFAMKLSRPFAVADLYRDDQRVQNVRDVSGENLKCVLRYLDAGAAPILVKVALSAVDVEGALANLDAEITGWDFDAVHASARAAWETALDRVRIDGADDTDDTDAAVFYTSLYHSLLAPTLFSDVDGRYRGADGAIHAMPAGRRTYSCYSLWDTYRTLHPLLTLIQPDRTPDIVEGLVLMAKQNAVEPPVWPLQGIETGIMIGWHSAVVLAEAYVKGVAGIDYAGAWPAYRKLAFDSDLHGSAEYRRQGWIAADNVDESVSRTLEYAYDDWAMATLAEAAGADDDARTLRERSRNYRHLYDPATGFMRGRLSNGDWVQPFDPRDLGHDVKRWRDFTETNAWQATFLNQHDLYGYIEMLGGPAAFEARLDGLFSASSQMPEGAPPDIAGLVGQYAHGNEPSHHVAYLYAYVGAHHKTQSRVRMLMQSQYQARPDGLSGNEDCGQMSAWYVMSALGLYPVDPVTGIYVFGSPLFQRVELAVAGGRLIIEAPETAADRPYIQAVQWNGVPYTRSWIDHAMIAGGGRLTFVMGENPNLSFGTEPADRPPSFERHMTDKSERL